MLRAAALVAALTATAHADDRTTYRLEIAGTDTASLALTVAGVKTTSPLLMYTGTAGMALGAGVVHFAHGHYEDGGLSIGLHVGAPILTTLFVMRVFKPCAEGAEGCVAAPVIAALAGWLAADLTDVFWLTDDTAPAATPHMLSFGASF
jgi:hypothetical protein